MFKCLLREAVAATETNFSNGKKVHRNSTPDEQEFESTNVAAKTSCTPHNMRLIFMNPKTFRIIIIIIIIKSLFILIKNRSANQRIGWYKPVISINIIENIIIIIFILECVRNI